MSDFYYSNGSCTLKMSYVCLNHCTENTFRLLDRLEANPDLVNLIERLSVKSSPVISKKTSVPTSSWFYSFQKFISVIGEDADYNKNLRDAIQVLCDNGCDDSSIESFENSLEGKLKEAYVEFKKESISFGITPKQFTDMFFYAFKFHSIPSFEIKEVFHGDAERMNEAVKESFNKMFSSDMKEIKMDELIKTANNIFGFVEEPKEEPKEELKEEPKEEPKEESQSNEDYREKVEQLIHQE